MNEIWKPVKGYEDYLVSNLGEVKSLPKNRHPTTRILRKTVDAYGYESVGFVRNKKHYTKKVHRLVAEAFIPNPEGKATVDHIDGNKLNNSADNLRWASAMENYHNPATFKKAQRENKTRIYYAIEGNYVYVRCVETGKITKGITNLAKKLGHDREVVRFRIRDGKPLDGFHYEVVSKERY